ncbi:MAG: hypothetical protein J5752_09370 [Clostridiales bacterium]|nr:hypothetical protein [Clostridiales bacterium]
MRKITAILIVLSMLFALAACKKKCEHEYSSTITKEATCAEEGLRTYTCSKCGDTYTEAIAKSNDHTYASEVIRSDGQFSLMTRRKSS